MAQERVTGPQSSAGIVQFMDAMSGGPKMDPRGVLIFTVLFIFTVKLAQLLMKGA